MTKNYWSLVILPLVIFSVPLTFSQPTFPPRQDGEYVNTGYPQITSFALGPFVSDTRQQLVIVKGDSLPKTLVLESSACTDTSVFYGSGKEFRFLCILKQVPKVTFRFIDNNNGSLIFEKITDIREVFDVKVTDEALFGKKLITVSGVNLPLNLQILIPECKTLKLVSKDKPGESKYSCELSSTDAPSLDVKIITLDGKELWSDTISLQEKKKIPETSSGKMTHKTLLDSDWLRLICEELKTEDTKSLLYLGECQMTSPFIREAFVAMAGEIPAQDKTMLAKALMEGKFEAGSKKIDELTQNLHGLKINPAKGHGLFVVDMVDRTMMLEGLIQGVGFDMENILFFPVNFHLYDYYGKIIISAPSFDIKKNRDRSKIVFGLGNVPGQSITILENARGHIKRLIVDGAKALSPALNKKKIQLGAKLINAIDSTTGKQAARQSYISILKMVQIVPEALGFYDNYDFIAKGKLVSEPFRPASMNGDQRWVLQANWATIDLDFMAKEGTMKIQGNFLNNLSLFNFDLIKPDASLIKAGILLSLKKDDGTLELYPVMVRLPANIAEVQAYALVKSVFKPEKLVMIGAVKGNIAPFGLNLVQADAELNFDPNAVYQIGDYKAQGVLDILAETELLLLAVKGRAVFTAPQGQAVVDLGGKIGLDFLGFEKDLADALSRIRLSPTNLKMCVNTRTGKVTFKIPFWEERVELQGGVSLDTEMKIKPGWIRTANLDLKYLALSGQANDATRVGFKVTSGEHWYDLVPTEVTEWNQPCLDAPGPEFLAKVPSILKDRTATKTTDASGKVSPFVISTDSSVVMGMEEWRNPLILTKSDSSTPPHQSAGLLGMTRGKNLLASASPSPKIIAEALASEFVENQPIETNWNVTGWKILGSIKDNGNRIIIMDKNGQEVKLGASFIVAPGIWKADDPLRFLIYSEKEMKDAGYHFAIKRENNLPVEFGIASYTNEQEKSHSFVLLELPSSVNDLSFTNLENTGKITVAGENIAAKRIDSRSISKEERKVEAEVESTPFSEYPRDEDGNVIFDKTMKTEFSDIRSPMLKEAITFLVQKKVVKGYPDGTFKPDKPLSRAEAVAMLQATGKIKTPWEDAKRGYVTMKSKFRDVQSNDWFLSAVFDAERAKIVDNKKSKFFKPEKIVNRAEFIKMLITMLEEKKPKKNLAMLRKQFKDVKRAEWFVPYAVAALERNLLDRGKTLRPSTPMTRADAAMMIYRMMSIEE